MDWQGCDLVEVVPGKVSGASLVRGTRIIADGIVANFLSGSTISEIEENFPSMSAEQIQEHISFARSRGGLAG